MVKTQVNLELEGELIAVLDGLAGRALKRQAVARMLLIAALEAVQANGNMVHLPPKFKVDGGSGGDAPTPANSGRPSGSQSVAAAVVSTAAGSLP